VLLPKQTKAAPGRPGFLLRQGHNRHGTAFHPLSAERRAAFEASARKGHNYIPTLSKARWTAFKRICRDDKDVKEFDLF